MDEPALEAGFREDKDLAFERDLQGRQSTAEQIRIGGGRWLPRTGFEICLETGDGVSGLRLRVEKGWQLVFGSELPLDRDSRRMPQQEREGAMSGNPAPEDWPTAD
jgi:hypothetical protein